MNPGSDNESDEPEPADQQIEEPERATKVALAVERESRPLHGNDHRLIGKLDKCDINILLLSDQGNRTFDQLLKTLAAHCKILMTPMMGYCKRSHRYIYFLDSKLCLNQATIEAETERRVAFERKHYEKLEYKQGKFLALDDIHQKFSRQNSEISSIQRSEFESIFEGVPNEDFRS